MHPSFSKLIDTLFNTRHYAIYDPEFQKHLKDAPWKHWLSQSNYFNVKEEYVDSFVRWIYSSRINRLTQGCKLDSQRYTRRDIIVGTTQSFDESYFRYHKRRLRLFRGEYGYHRRCYKNHSFLDQPSTEDSPGEWAEPLDLKDWVIVSHPFCGTGNEHPRLKELLNKCESKGIPVVLDCAWFGTCFDLDFDLDHPAITEISFSLSKGIGLGLMRTGLRFSNYPPSDSMPIAQQNLYRHLVLSNCQIGIYQMKHFGPDWQAHKYLEWYKKLCKKYDMMKTKCLHISLLSRYNKYASHFLVDESYAKVGVREALKAIRKKKLILEN